MKLELRHFSRAVADVIAHGDNDMLPFDIDNRFIKDNGDLISKMAFDLFSKLEKDGQKKTIEKLNSIPIFTERLLSPTGSNGFRISTKIHPFWNIYLNGLAVSIAEKNENRRSDFVHSYRYNHEGTELFDRSRSWRAYKQATLENKKLKNSDVMVVQTDISNFYEHIYHHRLENCIADLFHQGSTVAAQINKILNHIASGRSFGLPVGGQCSRILSELLMTSIDQLITQSGLTWYRYVDDFTLICNGQEDAYKAISILSNLLADYGLSLNKTKTIILGAQHYENFVHSQLFSDDDNSSKLKEIDLYFDPYSDNPHSDYQELTEIVNKLDVQGLLELETHKSQPDSFLISQISRTLKLHDGKVALQLCETLLTPKNLHAFRASWSTIIRGIIELRADNEFSEIHMDLDQLIDSIISHSKHLLIPESNCLHFLRALRFKQTDSRSRYIFGEVFKTSNSDTLKKSCIDCMRHWKDRATFNVMINQWNGMSPEIQRILWLSSYKFGDEGKHFRNKRKPTLANSWNLGIEDVTENSFAEYYCKWTEKEGPREIS